MALVALLLLEVTDELCQKPTAFNSLDWIRSCLIQSVLIGFNLLFFMLQLKIELGVQQSGVLLIIFYIPAVLEEQLRVIRQGIRNFEVVDWFRIRWLLCSWKLK